jgi:hypothetical protein
MKAYLIALGLLSVVLSWTMVHTVYTLRYARAYYSEPADGIEFNEEEPPAYTDFAYFSLTIGMCFRCPTPASPRRRYGGLPSTMRCFRASSARSCSAS